MGKSELPHQSDCGLPLLPANARSTVESRERAFPDRTRLVLIRTIVNKTTMQHSVEPRPGHASDHVQTVWTLNHSGTQAAGYRV